LKGGDKVNDLNAWVAGGIIVVLLALMLNLAIQIFDRFRTPPKEEPDDPIAAIVKQKEVIEDWLDGVGGVGVLRATAAVEQLPKLLGEVEAPGTTDAGLLAIRAGDEISQTNETLESLIEALDRVIDAVEWRANLKQMVEERVGFGARGG
jgi:hypothetical protein